MNTSIQYSFFPKEVKTDSNLLPSKIRLFFLMHILLIPILYIDYVLKFNGFILSAYILIWLYLSLKYVYRLRQKAKETFSWKKVEANVLNKEIYHHDTLIRHTMYPYQLRLRYQFTLNGETIISEQFALGQFGDQHCNYFFDSVENVRKLATRLIQNNKIYVYVNPENNESVVMQGYQSAREPSYIALLIGYGLAFFIAYIYIFV